MKLNTDGAVAHHKHEGGATAVCRDHNSIYLGSSTMVFHITGPVVLEAYACRESMTLSEDLDIQSLLVSSDCQGIVNDINQGTGGPHAAIIHEIIARRSSFQSCSFIHERRNFNFEAHNLAKICCNLGLGRHVWLGMLHDLTSVSMDITLNL
ncbi:hypothetical protein VPH35_087747 [Triticum aestivum]